MKQGVWASLWRHDQQTYFEWTLCAKARKTTWECAEGLHIQLAHMFPAWQGWSEALLGLPSCKKDVWAKNRIWQILHGCDPESKYKTLPNDDESFTRRILPTTSLQNAASMQVVVVVKCPTAMISNNIWLNKMQTNQKASSPYLTPCSLKLQEMKKHIFISKPLQLSCLMPFKKKNNNYYVFKTNNTS